MPAVSNTSPILNLAIIGQLDLLRRQFGDAMRALQQQAGFFITVDLFARILHEAGER